MVQEFSGTPQVADPSGLPLETGSKTGFAGFLSTTPGKLVVGGVLVLLIAGILGAIAVFFLFSQAENLVDGGITTLPSIQTTSVAEVAPIEREAPRLEDTFTFRNIFAPTIKPSVPESVTVSGDGTSTAGGASVPGDTLFLESVSVIDGDTVATLIWNGTTYVVGEGENLGETPWRVLSIDGASVTMLYGDTSVTLTVGQALGK